MNLLSAAEEEALKEMRAARRLSMAQRQARRTTSPSVSGRESRSSSVVIANTYEPVVAVAAAPAAVPTAAGAALPTFRYGPSTLHSRSPSDDVSLGIPDHVSLRRPDTAQVSPTITPVPPLGTAPPPLALSDQLPPRPTVTNTSFVLNKSQSTVAIPKPASNTNNNAIGAQRQLERFYLELRESSDRRLNLVEPFFDEFAAIAASCYREVFQALQHAEATVQEQALRIEGLTRGATSLRRVLGQPVDRSPSPTLSEASSGGETNLEAEIDAVIALREHVKLSNQSQRETMRMIDERDMEISRLRKEVQKLQHDLASIALRTTTTSSHVDGASAALIQSHLDKLDETHRTDLAQLCADQQKSFLALQHEIAGLVQQCADLEHRRRLAENEVSVLIQGRSVAQEALADNLNREAEAKMTELHEAYESAVQGHQRRVHEAETVAERLLGKIKHLEQVNHHAVHNRNTALVVASTTRSEMELMASDASSRLLAAEVRHGKEELALRRRVSELTASVEAKVKTIDMLRLEVSRLSKANAATSAPQPLGHQRPPSPLLTPAAGPSPSMILAGRSPSAPGMLLPPTPRERSTLSVNASIAAHDDAADSPPARKAREVFRTIQAAAQQRSASSELRAAHEDMRDLYPTALALRLAPTL